MILKTKILILFLFCAFAFANAQTKVDTLTNEKVISLLKAGFNSELVITKIKTSVTKFDVSMDALVKLNQAGVPGDVMQTMINPKAETKTTTTTNDSATIFKKWRKVSFSINGVEQHYNTGTVEYFKDGTFLSITTSTKDGKTSEYRGKYELSQDKKTITYFYDKSPSRSSEITKLTDKEMEVHGSIEKGETISILAADE